MIIFAKQIDHIFYQLMDWISHVASWCQFAMAIHKSTAFSKQDLLKFVQTIQK